MVSGDGVNIRPNGLDWIQGGAADGNGVISSSSESGGDDGDSSSDDEKKPLGATLLNGTSKLQRRKKPAKQNDWPHLDRTIRDRPWESLQGQVVLKQTTACFVCSPRSHLVHAQILDMCNISPECHTNWCKIQPHEQHPKTGKDQAKKITKQEGETFVNQVKHIVEQQGGQWQVPIMVPPGSVIIWASTLVHSARLQQRIEYPGPHDDPYLGWRCVAYISYQLMSKMKQNTLRKRYSWALENRTANHGNDKMFGKNPGGKHLMYVSYHPKIKELNDNPEKAYACWKSAGIPLFDFNSDECKQLTAYHEYHAWQSRKCGRKSGGKKKSGGDTNLSSSSSSLKSKSKSSLSKKPQPKSQSKSKSSTKANLKKKLGLKDVSIRSSLSSSTSSSSSSSSLSDMKGQFT